MNTVEQKTTALEDEVARMEDTINSLRKEQLNSYLRNLLLDLIDRVYRKRGINLSAGFGNDASRSTSRYAQAAQRTGLKIGPMISTCQQNTIGA